MFKKIINKNIDTSLSNYDKQRKDRVQNPCEFLTMSDGNQYECSLIQKLRQKQNDLNRVEIELSNMQKNPDRLLVNTARFLCDILHMMSMHNHVLFRHMSTGTVMCEGDISDMSMLVRYLLHEKKIDIGKIDQFADELRTCISYDEILAQKGHIVSDLKREIKAIKQELGIS